MKTSYLFVAALLLTALASCSKIQTDGGTKTLKDGTVYAGCTDAQVRRRRRLCCRVVSRSPRP